MFRGVVADEAVQGRRMFLQKDKDTGKSVRVRLRPVDPEEDRRYRHEIARLTRGRKFSDLSTKERAQIVDRVDALECKRAAHVLVGDTENFEYAAVGPKTAAALSQALGREIAPEEVVSLDGILAWSEELKAHLLEAIPGFATWCIDGADKLSNFDAEEEDEEADSFR